MSDSTATSAARPAPAFQASEGFNFRILLFALVVLVPVLALGWIYWQNASSGGIRDLPDGYKLVDFKSMVTFNFDQATGTAADIPEQYRALDGQKVQLRGQIFDPDTVGSKVQNFQLVYNRGECCFSGEPQVEHFVHAKAEGDAVDYYNGFVDARGTLHVDVQSDANGVKQVWRMDVEEIKPAG